MGSDFESLGINFEARAVILGSWTLIFRISEMDVCFYRKQCLRGPPPRHTVTRFLQSYGLTVFLEFCMWWIFVIFSAQRFHSGVNFRTFVEALGLFKNSWKCVTIVISRGLTSFGWHFFRGLDRECVLRLSFYRILRFGGFGGDTISNPFGINRCKKSDCLKTGQRLDSRRAETGAVAPLKENKEARHLRQPQG